MTPREHERLMGLARFWDDRAEDSVDDRRNARGKLFEARAYGVAAMDLRAMLCEMATAPETFPTELVEAARALVPCEGQTIYLTELPDLLESLRAALALYPEEEELKPWRGEEEER